MARTIQPLPQSQLNFLRPNQRYLILDEADNVVEGPFVTKEGAQGDLDYLQTTTSQRLHISDLNDRSVWDVEEATMHGFLTGENRGERYTLKRSRPKRSWLRRLLS